jgi:hypothetical protein
LFGFQQLLKAKRFVGSTFLPGLSKRFPMQNGLLPFLLGSFNLLFASNEHLTANYLVPFQRISPFYLH